MNIKNGRVYTASMMNLSNKLDRYGDANIENLSLLKLLYKYCDYCTTHKQLMRLDEMVNWLQINDSLICSEIMANRGSDYVWIPPAVDNTALETDPPIIVPEGSTHSGKTIDCSIVSTNLLTFLLIPEALDIFDVPAYFKAVI